MGRKAIWLEIEATLRGEIADGHYRPGDKLPTEAALATRFGVNRHTVRRAVAALQEDQLVQARRGAGVFVMSQPTTYRLGPRTRFTENLAASGQIARKTILRMETRCCDSQEAELLEIKQGEPVHVSESLGLSEGTPLVLGHSIFPAKRVPNFFDEFRVSGSVTDSLKGDGFQDYTRAWTRISAEKASATQASLLRCAEGSILLCTDALNVCAEGRPLEFGKSWFPGDRIELVVDQS
ncbi:MAG: phosphonate metabolism transcriptional regulator PhnF [Pseudomonadota bacterium]